MRLAEGIRNVLADEAAHTMHIMDNTGDTRIMWDAERPAEVEQAKATFDEMRAKGYVAYSVTKKGDQDKVVTEFDPDAEKLILAPALRGG